MYSAAQTHTHACCEGCNKHIPCLASSTSTPCSSHNDKRTTLRKRAGSVLPRAHHQNCAHANIIKDVSLELDFDKQYHIAEQPVSSRAKGAQETAWGWTSDRWNDCAVKVSNADCAGEALHDPSTHTANLGIVLPLTLQLLLALLLQVGHQMLLSFADLPCTHVTPVELRQPKP
jgi:hypothetical protein